VYELAPEAVSVVHFPAQTDAGLAEAANETAGLTETDTTAALVQFAALVPNTV
jgi:hypothetical protein